MSEMPKFDFSGCSIKNDEDLDQALAGDAKKESKVFKPGKHDVVIKAVVFEGMAKKDKTWGQLKVTLEGTNEKKTNVWVMFPTQDVKYGDKGTMFPFKKLQEFSKALGVELKASNLKPSLQSLFQKPEKLVGKSLSVKMAYEKAYPKFASKGDDGVNLNIILGDGSTLLEGGVPLVIKGTTSEEAYQAAEKFALDNAIDYSGFPQVVEYFPASEAAPANEQIPWD